MSALSDMILEIEATKEHLATTGKKFDFLSVPRFAQEHLENIIKARTLKVSGTGDHFSINWFLNNTLADIDKPRKYDFQKENVHEEDVIRSLTRYVPSMLAEDITLDDIIAGITGEKWIKFRPHYDCRCYDCGEQLGLAFKGNEVKLYGVKKCKSNLKYTVEIDFPTGEVIYGDWPDRFSEMANAGFINDKDFDINYLHGQREKCDFMATQQIFHHSVGNSSPRLYYSETEAKIQIGSAYDHEEDDYVVPKGFEEKGYFCTDLWWTTMIDAKYYNSMLERLPGQRSKKYYSKDVHTITIKPGRYRFTCNARVNDDAEEAFSTAEWIGPASGVEPEFEILDSNSRLKTLDEMVAEKFGSKSWDGKALHPDTTKFRLLDYIFNTIGNGIRSKGDFYSFMKVSKDYEAPVMQEVLEDAVPSFKAPYPGFKAEYTLIGDMDIKDIPTDWLEGGRWYYEKCIEYFAEGAQDYSYAYPGDKTKEAIEKDNEGFLKRFEEFRKPDMTEEQFYAEVSKRYESPYDGDLHKFRTIKWETEKKRCVDFCNQTIKKMDKELANRK